MCVLNRYSILNLDEVKGLRKVETEFYSYFNGQLHANVIWTGLVSKYCFGNFTIGYLVEFTNFVVADR